MNFLLGLGLLVISLGLLGWLRRSSQLSGGQESTGERTEAAAPLADGGAANDGPTGGDHSEDGGSFVFPANDGESDTDTGFIFAPSGRQTMHRQGGRAGKGVAMYRIGTRDRRSHRAYTTGEPPPNAHADSRSPQAINLIAEREEWITAWKQIVNTESTYHDTGAGWGVEFNGTILFAVDPDDTYATAVQSTDDISDGIAFVADLADGEVHSVTTIALDERDQYEAGFTIHAPYATWKALITQEIGLIDGLLSGQVAVEGDMQTFLRWSDGMVALVNSAGRVETSFLGEDEAA